MAVLFALLAGCQQQMARQPSYRPLDACEFFADGRSARPLVQGTVARGHLRTDLALYTGRRTRTEPAQILAAKARKAAGPAAETRAAEAAATEDFVTEFPFPVTQEVLEHGRHRYMIYCVVCHDALGTGEGKIVERGYTRPPSYHTKRLRNVPVGHLFAVISEGYGSMPSYGEQIPPRDRWAIAAYIRALQASQHFPEEKWSGRIREAIPGPRKTEPPAAPGGSP
jgi:mono/diheme cytochrome c family protein